MKAFAGFVIVVLILIAGGSCSSKLSEKEYFDKANQYMGQRNWIKAEEAFVQIYEYYPNGVFSSKALFMTAYINANELKNFEKARSLYEEFLKKYPNHELTDDARYELKHLGKTIDQLPVMLNDGKNNQKAPVNINSSSNK